MKVHELGGKMLNRTKWVTKGEWEFYPLEATYFCCWRQPF